MASPAYEPQTVRFGEFELDAIDRTLRRRGKTIRLPPQQFDVLQILVEQAGRVVSREEIRERIWAADTFVDFQRSINFAINQIRAILNDHPDHPRFIETVPKRGYRFIAPVRNDDFRGPTLAVEIPNPPSLHASKSPKRWIAPVLGLTIVAVLIAGVIAFRMNRIQREAEKQTLVLEASPFAAFAGEKSFPSFSPEGSRIAFGLNSDGKGFDLYVKALGSESVLRLTRHPSELISSAWSPDGTQIAFHRIAGSDSGIYLVAALGGPERRVRTTRLGSNLSWALPISWSPHGEWIAFADVAEGGIDSRISLLSTATWKTEPIRSWPGCQQESSPSFSHDGKYLAFACFMGKNESALYQWRIKSGEVKKMVSLEGFVYGLTWSADDRHVIYSFIDSAAPAFREVSIATGIVRQLGFAGSALFPVTSAGGHLAFITNNSHLSLWRLDLQSEPRPVRLLPSTSWEQDPDISPDGKEIAFQSGRSGVPAIWVGNMDGNGLVQLSTLGVPSGSPQWAPDGRRVAYDARPSGNWEIYVADVAERIPRKLVTNLSSAVRPHWSKDGQWIYFRSYEQGKAGIYRCPAGGGDATRLSKEEDASNPVESPDGSSIYFAVRRWKSILKSKNLDSGTESIVEGMPVVRGSNTWTLVPGGIYFIPDEEPNSLFYFDLATKKVKRIVKLERDFVQGLSVSMDHTWIAFSDRGDTDSNIMFVDRLE